MRRSFVYTEIRNPIMLDQWGKYVLISEVFDRHVIQTQKNKSVSFHREILSFYLGRCLKYNVSYVE